MAQIDVVLGGRYRLVRRIAAGGMGSVWEAEDTLLHRRVAVKVLSEALAEDGRFVERFRREARATAGLSHPNVAGVFDYVEDGDRPFLVMELIEGETLADRLARQGRLPWREAAAIIEPAAAALEAAHRAGIVHRDVKPGNIMITRTGHVKVMDFGIAAATWAAPLTATGAAMGTATYISPEQASGKGAGPESDVYSLGVVLYEMLTGRPPFTRHTPVAVAMAHVRDVPLPVRQLVPSKATMGITVARQ
ncbi:MAG TPA: protein kinase, partial [Actinomycetota bacterium]